MPKGVRTQEIKEFQAIIGVEFENTSLLDKALTHSSFANQFSLKYDDHNERLEFLGDSILSMVVSEYLYKRYKNKQEGKLTRIRAAVVCEPSLADISRSLKVNKYIRIGKGEELSGGREKDSLLADACEAIIAAIYLDRGIEEARKFILKNLEPKIESIGENYNYRDFKSRLQEYVQKSLLVPIRYAVIKEYGPPHDKTFEVEVYLDEKPTGKGVGKSKKEAEQGAAKDALASMGVFFNE
ncbi:MAG: ribonuclease III [Clostridium sp.]|uniref:ribonuclease III n=1 Tax=Clostridium sp. TaxID=1506 RepID=UPI002FCC6C49